MKKVRVRIAPSPTGSFHIGNARTALFNYLFARQNKGVIVLRIEDTDVKRSENKYTDDILNNLSWLGIEWDEGPLPDGKEKGDYGPYKQSERHAIYENYLAKLIKSNSIYKCFCTKEELEMEKAELQKVGKAPIYSGKCRNLTQETLDKYKKEGKEYIIRFKTPDRQIIIQDLVRDEVCFETGLLGDFSVAHDEKTPLYNLAVVIDDYEMKISHVIRGEDHLSNTPKQILLYEALGFPVPQFAHLPLILNEDRSKMSKRKNKVSLNEYRDEGYLPEAIINFLALLGWNPKTKEEIFTKDQLIEKFDIANIHKGGAIFNKERLDWINGQYIRNLDDQNYYELCRPFLEKEGFNVSDNEYAKKAVLLEKERIKKLGELSESIRFMFSDTLQYDTELLIWKSNTPEKIKHNLNKALEYFSVLVDADYNAPDLERGLKEIIKNENIDTGSLLWPIRAALTGKKASPGPFEVASALGKEKTIIRIKNAIGKL